jgi:superfamily II DNA/RNA helicase
MTPPNRQTLFFSATMPPEITRLTQQFLRNPVRIEVSRPATTGDNITQYVLKVPHKDVRAKRIALRTLLKTLEIKNGIVFCNRKTDVDIVAKSLTVHGFNAAPIHGDLDQSLRMKTLDAFRKGDLTLLVASDVAARGLDIPDVGHVFNFDVPHHADDYVHRIGRTGRAGRKGEAYLLLSAADEKNYDKVLKLTKKEPATLELEVDYSSLSDAPRGRSKDSRGEKRERPERGRRPERSSPAAETAPAVSLQTDPAEQPERASESVKGRKVPKAPVAKEQSKANRPAAARRDDDSIPFKNQNNRKNSDPFEGHMPAFMLRSSTAKT